MVIIIAVKQIESDAENKKKKSLIIKFFNLRLIIKPSIKYSFIITIINTKN